MRQSSADFDESTTILGDRMKEIVPRAALLVLMTPTSRSVEAGLMGYADADIPVVDKWEKSPSSLTFDPLSLWE